MKKITISLAVLGLTLAGCNNTGEDKLTVTSTVYPFSYMVENMTNSDLNINTIYPPGADIHSYEPSAKDIEMIQNSNIVFYTSEIEDSFINEIIATDKDDTHYINLSQTDSLKSHIGPEGYSHDVDHSEHDHAAEEENHDHAAEEENHDHAAEEENHDHAAEEENHDHAAEEENHDHAAEEENHDHAAEEENHDHAAEEDNTYATPSIIDPHIWVSPKMQLLLVEDIKNELVEHEVKINDESYNSLKSSITEIDKSFSEYTEKLNKKVIVPHNAFNYLSLDYGIEFMPLSGLFHEDEPSAQEMQDTIKYIKDNKINVIFTEDDNSNDNIINQIKSETDVEIKSLYHMTSETNGNDFLKMSQLNSENIKSLVE